MFGDESQKNEILLNRLSIAIVDSKPGENELLNSLNKKMKEESTKFKVTLLNNLEELYKVISQSLLDTSNSLLNMQWIDLVYNIRPSVIILYYYIKEGSTKEDEELSITKIIDKIKSYDQNLPLYLFIIVPPQEYDKYQHLKDDDKSVNSLRKKLKKENYYVFSSKEILKNIEIKKLYDNLILYSRNYYKQVKNVLKIKRTETQYTEEYTKYTIMIAILSIIKSKKKNNFYSKYLKEAYGILVSRNFNYKNYYYGNKENELQNFFEIKAIADWLLFKNLKLSYKKEEETISSNKKKHKNIDKGKNLDIQTKIDTFIEHIKTFSSHDYGIKKDDSFYFYNYFWKYKRFINLDEFCNKHFDELKNEKKYMLKIIQIKFYILYTFIQMMKFYQKYYLNLDLNKTIIESKEIQLSSISLVYNPFYGKPPIYAYSNENSEEKINIGYNDDVFLKLTITKNNLTLDKLDETFKGKLIKNIMSFYYKESIFEKGFEISNFDISNEIQMIGMKLYLNILRFYTNYPNNKDDKNLAQYKDEKDINFELYTIFEKSLNINKFPKIYIRFLDKNVEHLIYQMKNQKEKFDNIKKTILFKSLSILACIRLLTEEEQDIFNEILNDKEFIPTKYEITSKKPSVSLEINDFFVVGESEIEGKEKPKQQDKGKEKEKANEKKEEKNDIEKYIKEENIVIELGGNNQAFRNKEEKGITFEYDIKDINKSQKRKILDLVEYEFKISTKLEKLKLKFDNIKIFFVYTNQGIQNRYKTEMLIKEFNSEYLSNMELTKDTPIILEHKIFLKYREGKIMVKKILATLSKKKNIIYSIDLPNDIKKVIFIKDVSTNVLKFDYKNNFKVGKNQYNPFELQILKEKNDQVEIKDLKILFETLHTFQIKEFSSVLNLENKFKNVQVKKTDNDQNKVANSVLIPNQGNNQKNQNESLWTGFEQKEETSEKIIDPESEDKPVKYNSHASIDFVHLNAIKSIKTIKEKKNLKSAIKGKKENKSRSLQMNQYIPPEFYIYEDSKNNLEKYNEKMEIYYNDFESLLNKGKTKYTTLIRFLSEGSYKIMFTIIYFIRHIEIEEYIEYREESILEFNVINPFILNQNISSNNFFNINKENEEKKHKRKGEEQKRYYLTNCKIDINFILSNKIGKNIKIKDIELIIDKNNSIKYVNSYIIDLIHSYDLDEKEKKDMLIIQKHSSYTLPFEVEFSQPFKGSIGKINIIWSTEDLDNFENGKLNMLNKEEYPFPDIEIKPSEFEYKYEINKNNENEISLELSVKNVSNHSKQIKVNILNNNDNYDKEFILIGIDKQSQVISINEEIKFNYTLIPVGKGEFDYPFFQISEYDLGKSEKKSINHYYPQNIAII